LRGAEREPAEISPRFAGLQTFVIAAKIFLGKYRTGIDK
jgi:hypothetical protein